MSSSSCESSSNFNDRLKSIEEEAKNKPDSMQQKNNVSNPSPWRLCHTKRWDKCDAEEDGDCAEDREACVINIH
jgi:hypothetical protein